MAWQKPKSVTLHLSIRTQGKVRSKATPMTLGLIMIKDAHASEQGTAWVTSWMPCTACRRERCCSRAVALVMAGSRLSAWDRCCPLVSPGSCPRHAPGAFALGILIRLPAASRPTTPTTRCSSMLITSIHPPPRITRTGTREGPMLDSLPGSLPGSRPCLLVTGPSVPPSSDRREEGR
jgi:hypothetical protein